ncbi:hypothetical protein N8T08_005691 [Aspergillus melleus]|uniref:Uncharacterized protein n=1 Tax=Aspergillus melleus TaxID=138277 RepID=A0ACC3B1Q5_9EURO|nr:hypothetical protein N8T08_005691 [Aspergillus melleus]
MTSTPTPAAPDTSTTSTTPTGNSTSANRHGHGHVPRKRTRTGCLNCSRRRRKCDEAKPTCTGCKRRGDRCQWRMLGSFRDANLKVLGPEHPSMNQGGSAGGGSGVGNGGRGARQSKFKILNVVPSVSSSASRRRKHDGSGSPSGSGQLQAEKETVDASTPLASPRVETPPPAPVPVQTRVQGPIHHSPVLTQMHSPLPHPHPHPHPDFNCPSQASSPSLSSGISYHPSTLRPFDPHSLSDTTPLDDAPVPSTQHQPYLHSSPEYVVDELGALRHLPPGATGHSFAASSGPDPYPTIASPLFDHSVFSDPANFTNDVFLPGSAYEALHTALRNRQLWTARPDIPSRGGSPDGFGGVAASADQMMDDVRSGPGHGPGRYFALSPERENVLWQNYLNEICLWLDMFDNHRHFASTFPQMAKSATHLRYSILALSARQIERKQNEKSQSESLSLYQEAIHLLLPELENVCGGLISEEETIIPMTHWIPKSMDPREASALFLSSSDVCTFDTGCWTNALQPLWVAGKAMSHYSEHAAIVDTLTRIERETGWATAWRVEDLKEFWGDDDVDGDWGFED